MLSLRPPYLLAGNLMIFRDDKEEATFYYACQQPTLSVGEDGQVMISAYAIIPESGVNVKNDNILEAGLNLDVELSTTQEELDNAAAEIQKHFGVYPKVFSPAPIHSGNVYFTMAQSGKEPEKSGWFVTSGFSPSLFGNNKASLVVRTTGNNAELLIASIDAGVVPACVYYELELVGITPVYHASLVADMKLIYHHFEEKKNDNYIFYSEEINKAIDDLQDDRSLVFSVEELDPDIRAEAMQSLLNLLKSKVIDAFFQPVEFHEKSQDNKGSVLGKLFGIDAGLIKDLIPGRHYTKKVVDQSQLETITIDLSQSNAKTFTYYPQTLLKTMLERAGVNLSEKIEWVKIDDLPEKSQTVNMRVAADAFQSSSLKTIELFFRVVDSNTGDVIKEDHALFEAGKDELKKEFNYTRKRGVKYHYEYWGNMKLGSETDKLPTTLEVPLTRVESPYIFINPADYFKDYELKVYLDDRTMFDHTKMVQVEVTAAIGEVEILTRNFIFKDSDFNEGKLEPKQFSIVADRNADLHFHIKLTYYLPNSKDIEMENDVKEGLFFVPNPFENQWTVDIKCDTNWEKCEFVRLYTRVFDPNRTSPIEQKFKFTKETIHQVLSVACGLDSPSQTFDYLIEWLPTDGEKPLKSGWHSHEGGSVLVLKEKDFVPKKVVRVQLGEALDYEKWDIQYVEVKLRFAGEETQPQHLDSSTQLLKFVLDTDSEYEYSYRVRRSGNSKKSSWMPSNSYELLINIDKELL